MKTKSRLSKRPCRVCRRWFTPNARLADRQKTCGDPDCRREWHKRKCAQWNNKHIELSRTNTLQQKIETLRSCSASDEQPRIGPSGHFSPILPLGYTQEVIGAQLTVILEHLGQQLLKRAKELIKKQLAVNNG